MGWIPIAIGRLIGFLNLINYSPNQLNQPMPAITIFGLYFNTMKEIALIIHEEATLSTVTGAMDMLIHTNRLFELSGKPLPFKLIIASEKSNDHILPTGSLASHRTFAEI